MSDTQDTGVMTAAQRFIATLEYRQRDRCPVIDVGYWQETIDRWYGEGLPPDVGSAQVSEHAGADGFWRFYAGIESTMGEALVDRGFMLGEGLRVGLMPLFEQRVVEDRGDEEVFQQGDGCLVVRSKRMGAIPRHEGHLLTDRESWRTHYKPRLDGGDPQRLPADLSEWCARTRELSSVYPLLLPGGSTYGWIRNWMGLEEVSCVVHDDPAWFGEMIETVTDCVVGVLSRVLEAGGKFAGCLLAEDLAYNHGLLISPEHMKRFLVPQYRRLVELLHRYDVRHIIVDSDGRVDEAIPLWLDAGIDTIMPVEIGTTGDDPVRLRKDFGLDLRMIGGFDKRILARSPEAIDTEIGRLSGVIEDGGYIPTCDHKVSPDVPYSHYRHFLKRVSELR